jgi:hypothetical protein
VAAPNQNQPVELEDGFSTIDSGVDTGVFPTLLKKNQASRATNVTFRGGYPTNRPPYNHLAYNFGGDPNLTNRVLNGVFQGGGYYQPDVGSQQCIAQISGRLFLFTPSISMVTVAEITINVQIPTTANFTVPAIGSTVVVSVGSTTGFIVLAPAQIANGNYIVTAIGVGTITLQNVDDIAGATIVSGSSITIFDVNPNNIPQVWMWQAENYMIINDGQSLPIFYNGSFSRRSMGTVHPAPAQTGTFTTTADFVVPNANDTVLVSGTSTGINGSGSATITDVNNNVVYQIVSVPNAGQILLRNVAANNDNPNPPIPGTTVLTGQKFTYLNSPAFAGYFELPPGRMGAYGLGRNWVSMPDGISFIAGDIVGGPSGTQANSFRDAVLKVTENQFLAGGGLFRVPGAVGQIRAIVFLATLDASLGQGPVNIVTATVIFSCNAPVERSQWQSITNPILTEVQISFGGLGQWSSILMNGDLAYRAVDGIRSLILGRRDFATWGNVPISAEMDYYLDSDNDPLLVYSSAINFNNRLLMTFSPRFGTSGIYHAGIIALDNNVLSNLRGKLPSIYDGPWTGMNVLQLLTGEFNGVQRAFAFGVDGNSTIQFYEILTDQLVAAQNFDNTNVPIPWRIESYEMFGKNLPKGVEREDLKRLIDGEIYAIDITGRVDFQVYYKPDYYPCWVPWFSWFVCAKDDNCGLVGAPGCVTPRNPKPQYRPRMGFGEPSVTDCDPILNKPLREAFTFQVAVVVQGHCRVMGLKAKAVVMTQPKYAPQVCVGENTCAELDCCDPDLFLYVGNGGQVVTSGAITFIIPFNINGPGPFPPLILNGPTSRIVEVIPPGSTPQQIIDIAQGMAIQAANQLANTQIQS